MLQGYAEKGKSGLSRINGRESGRSGAFCTRCGEGEKSVIEIDSMGREVEWALWESGRDGMEMREDSTLWDASGVFLLCFLFVLDFAEVGKT